MLAPACQVIVRVNGGVDAGDGAQTRGAQQNARRRCGVDLRDAAAGIGLEFLTGELQSSHDPSGVVFTVLAALSGMEREYICDRSLEGHESACTPRGKTIGGAVTDEALLFMALRLRGQDHSLYDIAARLVIAKGNKKGRHPSPATVLRMLRDHDKANATATSASVPG
ncbi:hypothetical protein [Nonomuraea zeae]|uniref:hypothetical protein n=1 Tax=Nonomuraea zeae TaxID=1642303 RepID=UPI00197DBEB4|nr:hypothetical protein [Nonomuraea zeae]